MAWSCLMQYNVPSVAWWLKYHN